ncbi:MAG: hypothetical protein LBC63_00890 [Holophagales bacterium]|jgi:hypothetical protein|nr:hypothetical protein [Holophagales bacterium]
MSIQGETSAAPSVGEPPKSYEECLKEIMDLKADKDYGDWGAQTRPNKGRELTPESLDMSPEFVSSWAKRMNELFENRSATAGN